VEGDQLADIDVADAVAVGEAERLVADMLADAAQAPAGLRVGARIDQRHRPRLGAVLVHLHLVRAQVEGDVRHVHEVVGEVLLDHIAAVAETDHEVVETVVRIDLHDVPEDGHPPQLHHRLRPHRRLFAEPAPESAGKDHHFHHSSFVPITSSR
jgi:hypothetical protein